MCKKFFYFFLTLLFPSADHCQTAKLMKGIFIHSTMHTYFLFTHSDFNGDNEKIKKIYAIYLEKLWGNIND